MRRFATIAVALALALPTTGAHATGECSWRMYGHDLGRSMAQSDACSKISLLNVATLHPKWVFNAGAPITAQPAVVDNVVYVGAANGTFYALPADAIGVATPKWTFTIADANKSSYGKFVSSAAVYDFDSGRRVVLAAGGATLYVLDALTGAQLAAVCVDTRADESVRCKGSTQIIEIESSPSVVRASTDTASVYVGMDYNEGGIGRAGMIGLTLKESGSAVSLTPNWKFDPEGLATYTGADVFSAGGRGQGCGNTWSSPTVDVESNLVYFDISNCDTGRYKDATLYGGEAVFAIDATTGELRWCYSPRPVNGDDLDFGATPNLLPDGRVGVGGKDGAYYGFKRTAINAVSHDAATACRGAHGQTPDYATTVSTGGGIDGIIGTPAVGKAGGADAVFASNAIPMPDADTFSHPQRLTTLHAIDAKTGAVLWDAPNVFPAYAGPAYTNGVVFMPDTFAMNFTAFSADTGLPVWTFPMFAPSSPPAIVGDSIYVGSGVNPGTDAPIPGLDVGLGAVGVLYAFQAVAP
jgi:outer membrane protein assembly factor BamB